MFKKKDSYLQGVIFDCDGVLIDSKEANRIFYNSIFQHVDLPLLDHQGLEFVHSHSLPEAIDVLVPLKKRKKAWNFIEEFSYRQLLPYIRLESGLVDLLKSLQYCHIKCAVNTNRSGTMEYILEQFGLDGLFFPVITSLDVTWPKPHPESIHLILSKWDISYNEVVFVGDSRVDEQAARAAGIEFWAYKNDFLQAHWYIQDYWSLQQCLFEEGMI
jgi:HAD superfamily hydrolase (TIGR01509 family)